MIDIMRTSMETYPYNLIFSLLFGTTLEQPPTYSKDVLLGFQYAFSTLEETEQKLLYLRFAQGKNRSEAAVLLSLPEEELRALEDSAFYKLRLPGRWDYIRYGVAGYVRKRVEEERRKAYQEGFCTGYQKGKKEARRVQSKELANNKILDMPIESMGLSTKAYHCLQREKCRCVRDVAAFDAERVDHIRGMGPKTAGQIARILRGYGIANTAWDKYLPSEILTETVNE